MKISSVFGVISAVLFLCGKMHAQPAPAPPQDKSVLLTNGTAHIGNGEVIPNSYVAFDKGKLTVVGNAVTMKLDMSKFDTVINIQGKHVYPGFIAPNSTLGLQEIGAVRATRDQAEVGRITPHVRSLIAYNTESHITPTVRTNGVLTGQITPRSGLISGTSSIVEFDAWNWEDAAIKKEDGVHLNWPKFFIKRGWWANPGPTEKNKKHNEQVEELRQFFKDARAYNKVDYHLDKNLRFEAMKGIFGGTKNLYIHADFVKEITEAVYFAREFDLENVVIVGGYDSWLVADLLKENDISVMLRRIHSLPKRPEDDIDLPFKLPSLLHEKGVLFCLQNAGGMEQMQTRNLPFYAGTAVSYGLEKEEALKALTFNTAKILGIDDRLGTLEPGKDATLFVSEGDALDMMSNNVIHAYIRGRDIILDNHQKKLYRKYKMKYERQSRTESEASRKPEKENQEPGQK